MIPSIVMSLIWFGRADFVQNNSYKVEAAMAFEEINTAATLTDVLLALEHTVLLSKSKEK